MVLVQKWPALQLFYLGNIGQENVFYDIRERKNAFLSYKNKKFKSRKIHIFQKGLTHGFWSKNGHFSNFSFLGNMGQENVFNDILERKNGYLCFKNKKFKKPKVDIFPKGITHSFGTKMAIFSTFFFR